MPEAKDETTEVEIDTDSALAEISESLFGQDDEETVENLAEVPEGEPPVAESVEAPLLDTEVKSEEVSPEVQALGAPKTWTKEGLAEWAKIPVIAQREILKREEDIFRGLEQYKERAELGTQYDKVVEPYRATLAAENIDPVQLFNSFAGNHYLLSRGTPEQKLSIAANLIQHYGIDPVALMSNLGERPQVDPAVQELRQYVQGLEQKLTARDQSERDANLQTISQQVEAFRADPAHPHFDAVSETMTGLIKSGAATTLQQAYETAVWANPATRQKELDRETAARLESAKAESADRVAEAKAAQGANVRTTAKDRNGAIPVGSMDDTLNATYESIRGRA